MTVSSIWIIIYIGKKGIMQGFSAVFYTGKYVQYRVCFIEKQEKLGGIRK